MRIKTPTPPPPLPGLKYWADSRTADGPRDALVAAGVLEWQDIKRTKVGLPEDTTWRPYQVEGIEKIVTILKTERGAILADDMGLGKTPQGAGIAYAMNVPTLVVCPAGVRHQWKHWMEQVGFDCAVLGPPSDEEFEPEWAKWNARTVKTACVSYTLMGQAIKGQIPNLLIFDEPHGQLQGRANTYVKVLWKYGGAIPYKLMLTGTPYLARVAGMWQMLNILHGPYRWGRAREFDIRYCNGHPGQWGWNNDGASNVEEFKLRLKHFMIRRMKSEVAKDLPAVTRTIRWINGTKEAAAALATAGHSIVGLRGAVQATLEEKDWEVYEVMKAANFEPTTVFTWQRQDADRLGELLNSEGIDARVIHGENTAAKRAVMVAEAHAAKASVITTYGSSGQGLDGLQKWISNVIFHAIDPVPAIILQASGRHDRIGQTMPVTETYLAMHNSVDELSVDKVVTRLDVWERVMSADMTSTAIKKVLADNNMTNDAVMDSIFKEMTK